MSDGPREDGYLSDEESAVARTAPSQRMCRWLVCPMLFLVAQWWLLIRPKPLLAVLPALWTPPSQTVRSELPPYPANLAEAFRLGWVAHEYNTTCNASTSSTSEQSQSCQALLRQAGRVVGVNRTLTAKELFAEEALLVRMAAERSLVDRVLGFFTFVNIIWVVSVVGVIFTVGPCLAYLCGSWLMERVAEVFRNIIVPTLQCLEAWGVLEATAYVLAMAFTAQGSRYLELQSDSASIVCLAGGLAFVPAWGYSTKLHTVGKGDADAFMCLSGCMLAGVLVPLALIHESPLIGFCAVLAFYASLGFVFAAFGWGFVVGFQGEKSMRRCLVASIVLILMFSSFRVLGLDPLYMRPFAVGVMCLGNIMYFLALLILSSKWSSSAHEHYIICQIVMVMSLTAALFVGSVFSMPAMTNTAVTFLVLYIMEKELEFDWHGFAVVVAFLNFAALFCLALFMHNHADNIVAMFDPKGLYI